MLVNRNIGIAAAGAIVVLAGLGAWGWTNGPLRIWTQGVHAVDFHNAPVEVFGTACADPDLTSAAVTTIPLRDGSYQLGKYQFELVGDVKYGDVSGQTNTESGEKAVFVGSCNSGGQTSQVLFVYGIENSKPVRVATADLSSDGSSLVQSYNVDNGTIQIKQNEGTPPQLVNVSYALLNGKLQNVGGGTTQVASNTSADSTPTTDDPDIQSGDDKISYQYFHDQLSPYGEWVDHPRWGSVWRPGSESADFRPYRDGHWENTDDYGTTWVADSDWGDIVYHYGRWAYDPNPDYHWVWVPGYTWAPSWVVWRAGDGNVGWFPMPPGDYDGVGDYPDVLADWYGYRDWYGADLTDAAFYGLWSFVAAADLFAPRIDSFIIAPGRYGAFIGRTRNWTRYAIVRGRVVNRSFEPRRFRAAFGRNLPVSHGRNLFHHRVPMTSFKGGHNIGMRERMSGHGLHQASFRSGHVARGMHEHGRLGSHAEFGRHGVAGNGFSHRSFGHSASRAYAHSGFSRGVAAEHGFSRNASRAGGYPHSGYSRGQGFSRSGNGFARGGMGSGQGYARSGQAGFARGGYGSGNGFGRGGMSGNAGNAYNRGGANSFGGGNAFARGGGGFGGGGNAFQTQRAAAPRFGGGSNGGGGNGGGGNRRRGH